MRFVTRLSDERIEYHFHLLPGSDRFEIRGGNCDPGSGALGMALPNRFVMRKERNSVVVMDIGHECFLRAPYMVPISPSNTPPPSLHADCIRGPYFACVRLTLVKPKQFIYICEPMPIAMPKGENGRERRESDKLSSRRREKKSNVTK